MHDVPRLSHLHVRMPLQALNEHAEMETAFPTAFAIFAGGDHNINQSWRQ